MKKKMTTKDSQRKEEKVAKQSTTKSKVSKTTFLGLSFGKE